MARDSSKRRGPAKGEAYGVAGLTRQLHGIHFPISRDEIMDRWGDEEFQWTKEGETYSLRECLQGLPEEVQSVTQITHTVSENVHQGTGKK